ncbi:MAG: PsiF family protein [Rubrivivax sp.]
MKRFTLAMALTLACLSTSTFAANHAASSASAPMGKQQTKMASCNTDAAGKKGEERKAFMKTCLTAKKPTTQQSKMKTCNADAAGKKGDERKAFMKTCLAG